MKKAVNCWTFPDSLSDAEAIKMAGQAGFQGIEFSITSGKRLNAHATDQDLARLRQVADDAGVSIHSIACSLNWHCSLTSDRADIRQQAKDNIRKQVHFASVLGADAILTLPGFVGVDFSSKDLFSDPNKTEYAVGSEVIDYDIAWERAVAAYRELAPFAGQHGVTICVENIWSKFLLSPIEMRRFLDEIGSDFVKAYFDVGNVMMFGYPDQWIRILGPRIRRIHFKDFKRGVNSLSGFVDLLSGDVDFPKVMMALKAVGYDGWVTAEINAYRQHPELTVWNTSAAMDRILG